MELTQTQTNNSKGIAILMMLCLHLFNTLNYQGLFVPLIFIGDKPLVYYISLFCDCCVPIYCFCSGYGLYVNYINNKNNFRSKNYIRIFKLYINYWIILLLIPVGFGFYLGSNPNYPGSFLKFLANFFAINTSYNGAWWFVTVYILLVLSSTVIFRIIEKFDFKIILFLSFCFYFLGYLQRVKTLIVFENWILDFFILQLALFANSQFMFVVGAISYQKKWFSTFSNFIKNFKFKNLILFAIIILSIIFHGIIPSFFIAVFTGFVFIFCFNALNFNTHIEKIMIYFGNHSTNIWLVHMFFYAYFFKEIIYAPQYPILIFLWLLAWSLTASYIINLIYNPISKWVNTKLN